MRWAAVRVFAWALSAVLWAAATMLTGPFALATPAPPIEVNVYVVPAPQQDRGRAENLRAVASRTLDDPDRAGEILELNRGRRQPDGGALGAADDVLRPGWLLRLPDDARGSDVRRGVLSGASAPSAPSVGPFEGPIRIPIVLVVIIALVLLQVTLAIVFRRALERGLRVARGRLLGWWRRLLAPGRRRRELRANRATAAVWRGDHGALAAASRVFAELAGADRQPVAAELHAGRVVARTAAGAGFPPPWQEHEPNTWQRPLPGGGGTGRPVGPPVVRVGGTFDAQVLLDLSRCDGVVAVTGDPAVSRGFVVTLLGSLASQPGVDVEVVGTLPDPGAPVRRLRGSDEVEGLVGPPAAAPEGPLRAGARRHHVRGVIAVGDDVDSRTAGRIAELCERPGSNRIAIVLGTPVTSHWRWTVHGNGIIEIRMLGRDLVAAL